MDSVLTTLFRLLCVIQVLIQLATSQLTGRVTSPDNLFIVNISITNPTSNTISLLNWNNVFDFTCQLPYSFIVRDSQGNEIQQASTYAMRSGISISDLYDLEPGQGFSRQFDLRQVLQNNPSSTSRRTPQSIRVSLPVGYKGISHSGGYQIPTAAAASLSGQTPTLGDYSAAGLEDVTMTARALSLQLTFPIFQNIEEGYSSPPDGVRLNTNDCRGQSAAILNDALFDAGVYAKSLSLAASDPSGPLFTSFFSSSMQQMISKIAFSVENTLQGHGPHIDVYCTDGANLCSSSSNILGYSFTPSWIGNGFVVLCPSARSLPRAPIPCTSNPGVQTGASASHVMFHLLLTLNNIATVMIEGNIYGSGSSEHLKTSVVFDPTKNPDSYAQLAISEWAYGLGGAPYNGASCFPANGHIPQNQKRSHLSRTPRAIRGSQEARQYVETTNQGTSPFLAGKVAGAQQCTGTVGALLEYAIRNAQALAAAARDYRQIKLWKMYFNGDPAVDKHVTKVFDNIARWNTSGSGPAGTSFYCDSLRKTRECLAGAVAWVTWDLTGAAVIVLCPSFFMQPIANQCFSSVPRNPGQLNNADQGGFILHEMTHIPWLNDGQQIGDGFAPDGGSLNCYTNACATGLAANRNNPGVDPRNLPERNAANYEIYAYQVRATENICGLRDAIGALYGYMQG